MRSGLAVVAIVVIGVVMALASGGVGETSEVVATGKVAPEIARGEWINAPPLTLAGLRGRVVLVEFWTYG